MLIKTYTPIWHKYRPVILKMMIDSKNEPQTYQLSQHEFKAMNSSQKGGYAFTLQVGNGRLKNSIKDVVVAQDLWQVLQLSSKANELISDVTYQFAMDKNYMLRVEVMNNQI
jgi:hypothetical protein